MAESNQSRYIMFVLSVVPVWYNETAVFEVLNLFFVVAAFWVSERFRGADYVMY